MSIIGKTVPELDPAATLTGDELLHVVQGGNSRSTSVSQVNALVQSLLSSTSGAALVGTSSGDTVQEALDAKQDSDTALTTTTTFSGDVSGTYDAIIVADDSHNHVISNVDGLQTALDAKAEKGANTDITSMSGITGGISSPDYIDFDTGATVSRATGRLWWDNADGISTLNLGMAGSDVTQQVGEELYFRIKASAAIAEGEVVMFTGTVGASGALTGAPATGLTKSTASYVMGVATEAIALNGWGYVTQFGLVRGVDTLAFSDGDILYLDPTVAGGLTATVPASPAPKVEVAAVVYAAGNGSLFVRPTARFELEQLNDVETAGASDTDLLQYNGTSGVWEHSPASSITVGNVSGTVAITNGGTGATTSVNARVNLLPSYTGNGSKVLALNSGATDVEWIAVGGSGTVTSVAASAGTGISVTGSPITTSGTLTITNTAPDQTVTLTQAGTTTITGTYPNFTISSADQYDGTVTSVAASVPTGFTVGGSPITTSGTLAIGFDTGYSLPTTASQTNWDTAYTDRYKWDGGASGLVAATGRTSLGLGTSATLNSGVAGGVATLDGGGTVPTSQLPSAVLGAVKYQGTWNASTNTPTLTSSTGTDGHYYVVSTAGSTNLDGITDWKVGDWAIFNGTVWEKVDNTDAVSSVNGYTGTVTLDYSDVGAYADTNPSGYTTNTGTVTSVGGTGTVNGLSLTGTVTTSGNLTLGGTLAISNADWSGTDLSVANGGTGTSSLTSGYLLKGNGTSAVTASVVYDNGTSVGIGTTTPGAKLDVAGDILVNSQTIGRGGGNVSSNVVIGSGSLAANTSGSGQVAIGNTTLAANTTGVSNVAIGQQAMRLGNHNYTVAIGYQALYDHSGSTGNTSIGFRTMYGAASTAGRNIAIGYTAMGGGTLTGQYNAAVGDRAGFDITSGQGNCFFGNYAGGLVSSGSHNVLIGGSMSGSAGLSNTVIIGCNGVERFFANGTTAQINGIDAVLTTSTQTLTNKTLTAVVLDGGFSEEVYALSGTTPALDPANGSIQTWTLTANSTPTDSIAAGESLLIMVADGTAYTVTWPSVTWIGGSAPTLAASGYTVVELWKVGSTLYGAYVGDVA